MIVIRARNAPSPPGGIAAHCSPHTDSAPSTGTIAATADPLSSGSPTEPSRPCHCPSPVKMVTGIPGSTMVRWFGGSVIVNTGSAGSSRPTTIPGATAAPNPTSSAQANTPGRVGTNTTDPNATSPVWVTPNDFCHALTARTVPAPNAPSTTTR